MLPVPATTESENNEYVVAAQVGTWGAAPLYAKIEFETAIGDAHVTPVALLTTVLNVNTAGFVGSPSCCSAGPPHVTRNEFSMSYLLLDALTHPPVNVYITVRSIVSWLFARLIAGSAPMPSWIATL